MPAGSLLHYALVALVIALIAAFLGFGGIAGAAAGIAQTLSYVFLVVFLVVLIMNFTGRGRGPVPRPGCDNNVSGAGFLRSEASKGETSADSRVSRMLAGLENMRKGMDGLALLAQQVLTESRHRHEISVRSTTGLLTASRLYRGIQQSRDGRGHRVAYNRWHIHAPPLYVAIQPNGSTTTAFAPAVASDAPNAAQRQAIRG